jgi:hypothetical protein
MPYGMLEVATFLRSWPPRLSDIGALLPTTGGEATNGAVTTAPKVAPPPAQIFIRFRTLAMACANFTITTPIGLTGVLHPVLGRKTSLPLDHFRFGGQSSTRHCHGDASSCKPMQAAVAGPILGIDFLRKFKVTVAPEINQIQYACTAAASPAPYLPSAARPPPHVCLAHHRFQPRFQSSCQLRRLLPSLLPYPHMISGIPR